MFVSHAKIDCSKIHDRESFHAEFKRVFAFPDSFGRSMDGWIDCMSSLDAPEDELTGIHVKPGDVLALELVDAKALKDRAPEIYEAIVECAAFVNWRRMEIGEPIVLALSFNV